jgi:hypothetical protein
MPNKERVHRQWLVYSQLKDAMTFFGGLQRIYVIFAASPERWKILEDTVPYITANLLSDTRWECRLESVKALWYQLSKMREALVAVADEFRDPMVKAEAESLANFEVGNFEFILARSYGMTFCLLLIL